MTRISKDEEFTPGYELKLVGNLHYLPLSKDDFLRAMRGIALGIAEQRPLLVQRRLI
jgi:hypothetical protein